MKEIIRDIKTGKRKVNLVGFGALIIGIICLGLIVSDIILLCMGACFTWLGVLIFITKVMVVETCFDYLVESGK